MDEFMVASEIPTMVFRKWFLNLVIADKSAQVVGGAKAPLNYFDFDGQPDFQPDSVTALFATALIGGHCEESASFDRACCGCFLR